MTKQFFLALQQQELYCTANRKHRISQANSKTCNRDSVFTESLFVLYKNYPRRGTGRNRSRANASATSAGEGSKSKTFHKENLISKAKSGKNL